MEKSNMKLAGAAIVVIALCLVASFCWYGTSDDNPVARNKVSEGDWAEYKMSEKLGDDEPVHFTQKNTVLSIKDGVALTAQVTDDNSAVYMGNVRSAGIVIPERYIADEITTGTIMTAFGLKDIRICIIDLDFFGPDTKVVKYASWIGEGNVEYRATLTYNMDGETLIQNAELIGSSLFKDYEEKHEYIGLVERGLQVGDHIDIARHVVTSDIDGNVTGEDYYVISLVIDAISGNELTVSMYWDYIRYIDIMTTEEFTALYTHVDGPEYEYKGETKITSVFGERECDVYRMDGINPNASESYVDIFIDIESGLDLREHSVSLFEDNWGSYYEESTTYYLNSSLVAYG